MIEIQNKQEFQRALSQLPNDLHRGAVRGLHKAVDDWLKRSRAVAPEDIGFLKTEMRTEIDTALLEGSLLSNAYSQGFNYAYFLHEVGSKKGYSPRKAGRSLTWLEDTMDEDRSWNIVEKEIKREIDPKWR